MKAKSWMLTGPWHAVDVITRVQDLHQKRSKRNVFLLGFASVGLAWSIFAVLKDLTAPKMVTTHAPQWTRPGQ